MLRKTCLEKSLRVAPIVGGAQEQKQRLTILASYLHEVLFAASNCLMVGSKYQLHVFKQQQHLLDSDMSQWEQNTAVLSKDISVVWA